MAVTLKCTHCNKIKEISLFARNSNNEGTRDGYDFWCSVCRKKSVNTESELVDYCRENNRGFNSELFKLSMNLAKAKLKKNNIDEENPIYFDKLLKSAIGSYFSRMNLIGNEGEKTDKKMVDKNRNKKANISNEIISRWGDGFEPFEYEQLELYHRDLMAYYEIENPVHKNLVRLATMNAILSEKALRENRTVEYEKLQKTYSSILSDSRLKPSQKNAAEGTGLATVGQWVEKIELIDGIIPQFGIKEPDKLDEVMDMFIRKMSENLGISGGV